MDNMMTTAHTAVWYTGKLLRANPMRSPQKEKIVSFSSLFLFCLYEKMNVSWTYSGNHFTIHANQTIMSCTLNIHSDVCQLFLNKTVKKTPLWDSAKPSPSHFSFPQSDLLPLQSLVKPIPILSVPKGLHILSLEYLALPVTVFIAVYFNYQLTPFDPLLSICSLEIRIVSSSFIDLATSICSAR